MKEKKQNDEIDYNGCDSLLRHAKQPEDKKGGQRMLELKIDRFAQIGNSLHGRFWVDGQWVCDSLENAEGCLSDGEYSLAVKRVKAEGCRCILVDATGKFERKQVSEGTLPIFKNSNGIWNLNGGDISLGECEHLGYILRCNVHLDILFWRLLKNQGHNAKCNAVLKVSSRPDMLVY